MRLIIGEGGIRHSSVRVRPGAMCLLVPYANIMNRWARRKPIRPPQAGKVSTHARTMLRAIPQLTRLNDLLAPTPMMAEVLQWPVETGMPVRGWRTVA